MQWWWWLNGRLFSLRFAILTGLFVVGLSLGFARRRRSGTHSSLFHLQDRLSFISARSFAVGMLQIERLRAPTNKSFNLLQRGSWSAVAWPSSFAVTLTRHASVVCSRIFPCPPRSEVSCTDPSSRHGCIAMIVPILDSIEPRTMPTKCLPHRRSYRLALVVGHPALSARL